MNVPPEIDVSVPDKYEMVDPRELRSARSFSFSFATEAPGPIDDQPNEVAYLLEAAAKWCRERDGHFVTSLTIDNDAETRPTLTLTTEDVSDGSWW